MLAVEEYAAIVTYVMVIKANRPLDAEPLGLALVGYDKLTPAFKQPSDQ